MKWQSKYYTLEHTLTPPASHTHSHSLTPAPCASTHRVYCPNKPVRAWHHTAQGSWCVMITVHHTHLHLFLKLAGMFVSAHFCFHVLYIKYKLCFSTLHYTHLHLPIPIPALACLTLFLKVMMSVLRRPVLVPFRISFLLEKKAIVPLAIWRDRLDGLSLWKNEKMEEIVERGVMEQTDSSKKCVKYLNDDQLQRSEVTTLQSVWTTALLKHLNFTLMGCSTMILSVSVSVQCSKYLYLFLDLNQKLMWPKGFVFCFC